jgi:hypothetical protein
MRIHLLLAFALFVAGPACADATRDALAEIAKCADIADSSERLKCFDAAVPHAKSALTAPAPQDAEKRGLLEWFGFARPSKAVTKPEDFGIPAPEPGAGEITEIAATVVEFAKTARGRSIFILDNGQVWRQLDADGTDIPYPRSGTTMKVTIETGWLGSYNLTIAGRNGLTKVFRMK